jgi:hypothetical protein
LKVHLLSAYSRSSSVYVPEWLAAHCNHTAHSLTEDPVDADIILFAETYNGLDPHFIKVIRHPVFRRFPSKCVLYHISDVTLTLCRTISPSIDRYNCNLHLRQSFSYIVRIHENLHIDQIPEAAILSKRRRHLFSFTGEISTHPVRSAILDLVDHPEAHLRHVPQRSSTIMSVQECRSHQESYLQTILDSEFVLCPRGIGPTSMRLFEVMQLGRVPVVIGDNWLPVADVPWREFAVFIPENDIKNLPTLLTQNRHLSTEMGKRARAVWLETFAPHHCFDQLIKRANTLIKTPQTLKDTLLDIHSLLKPRNLLNVLAGLRHVS